ncbi:ABC transporter substrate-binding protein [Limnochorda pilosa]|uniref:ABC transporter substrate-binding protein n=1 Tax=Limnochorda pilosa TaxID=1555112 RepID=A0A0K2SG17_LIMPI|nr:ABC transporter substrate-binding protein [Limnochorda pilosa]BAS26048.1 ABC transporter substrate-binding protein [Limnochorda pilosa]
MRRDILAWLAVAALSFPLAPVLAAQGGTVTILGTWGGQELAAFEKVLEPFEAATGINVEFTGTRDLPAVLTTRVQAGDPPDMAALPNPGQMQELAAGGHLVDLGKVLDMKQLRNDYAPVWVEMGSYGGKLQAIFISADLKSLVWYDPKAFAAAGYSVPTTWDEMMALTDRIASQGETAWSIGLESGAASGWPGTDWIEDIMLRTAGPALYDQWVAHDIPWTHPAVKRAFEIFGQIARNPRYVYGGPTAVLSTNFGDAANPLFTKPPGAYLHRQASFITSFIREKNPGLVAGEDFTFFPLPAIDPKYGVPALGAADMIGVFKDTPQTRALVRYLATPGAQEIWVAQLGKLSAHKRVNPNAYPDELTRKMAEVLVNAQVFRFDGSDLMPPAVGSGAFWEGVLNYVGGEDLDTVLETIEAAADDAYTSGKATD